MHPESIEKCKSPITKSVAELRSSIEHYLPVDGGEVEAYRRQALSYLSHVESFVGDAFKAMTDKSDGDKQT